MLTRNSKPTSSLPKLSGSGANLGYDPLNYPFTPGEGVDFDTLSVKSIRPRMGHGNVVSGAPSLAPILAAYYINPPIFDSHVFRKMEKKAETFIRDYNRNNNSNFFNDYPELRLALDPTLVLDYRKQAAAMTAWFRDYLTAITFYMSSVATHRLMSKLGGQSRFSRFGSSFRWSTFHTQNRVMSDYWVPGSVKNYITAASRILTGVNSAGAPVVAFPIWRADMLGRLATRNITLVPDAALDMHCQGNLDIQTAMAAWNGTGAIGVMPNGLPIAPVGISAGNALIDGVHPSAGGSNPGYVATNVHAMVNHWRTDVVQKYFADMSVEGSAFLEVFKQLGWVDTRIDIESYDRAIRDNQVGDISTFSDYMAYMSRKVGTFGHLSRITFYGNTAWDTSGLDLTPDQWAAMLATYEEGTTPTDPCSFMEQMYAIRFMGGVSGDEFEGYPAHETLGGDPGAMYNGVGTVISEAAGSLTGGSAFNYLTSDEAIFYGLSEDGVKGIIDPSMDPALFVDEAEARYGLRLVRQVHLPLIDVSDPLMCGFFVISSNDEPQQCEWSRAVFDANNADITATTSYDDAVDIDIMYPVGDAVLLHPSISQSRVDIGPVIACGLKDGTPDDGSIDVVVGYAAGLPLTKPYTVRGPEGTGPNLLDLAAAEDTPYRLFFRSTAGAGDYSNFIGTAGGYLGAWTWFVERLLTASAPAYKHLRTLYTVAARGMKDHLLLGKNKVSDQLALSQPYAAGSNSLPESTLAALVVLPSKFAKPAGGKGAKSEGRSKSRSSYSSKPPAFSKSEILPMAAPSSTSVVVDPPAPEVLGASDSEPSFEKKFETKDKKKKKWDKSEDK